MSDPAISSFPCILRAWNAHESELRNFLRHRAGDAHLADDLLQEVFVKAMQQGKQFCTLDNERAWLFQGKTGHFATPKLSVMQRRRTEFKKDATIFYWSDCKAARLVL